MFKLIHNIIIIIMIEITFNDQFYTLNKFKKEHESQIQNYGVFLRSYFILTSHQISSFISLCNQLGYSVQFSENAKKNFSKLSTVHISYSNSEMLFIITFFTYQDPPITKTEFWKKLFVKCNSSQKYYFYLYPLLLAVNKLKEEKYVITYDEHLTSIFKEKKYNNELVYSSDILKTMNWTPFSHQIQCAEKIYEKNGKIIIADEAGLGKTTSAILGIIKLLPNMKYKRGIWIVPTTTLLYQVVDELKERFKITAIPITHKITKKNRITEDENQSIYSEHSFIVMTWAVFRNDWIKNLPHLWGIKFGFAIFDEIHQAKLENKTFEAILNFPSEIRIGLTGTPLSNGEWRELYNIIYAVDPLILPPISIYYNRELKLIEKYKKISDEHKNSEKDAQKVMNKITNNELIPKIIRHTRTEIQSFLPTIIEIQPINTILNGTEDLILTLLFELLENLISDWIQNRKNYIIEYSKSMIWQDIRRFCAYGGKNFHLRIKKLLSDSSKATYVYIQKKYKNILLKIEKELQLHPITDYPKFPLLYQNLFTVPHHHVLIFCDSILTCLDLAEYLSEKNLECKVITGEFTIDTLFDDEYEDKKEAEITRIRSLFTKLHQSEKMSDESLQAILEWFWEPYFNISHLSDHISNGKITYILNNNGKEINNCHYSDLKKTIQINIYKSSITEKEKDYLSSFETVLKKYTSTLQKISDTQKISYIFTITENDKNSKILITTNKLAEGCNLQIAQTIIFYDLPLSIKEREQRIARIHRMGSPYDQIYLFSLICGIEHAIKKVLDEKYNSTGNLKFSETEQVSMFNIIQKIKEMQKQKNQIRKTLF